MAAGFYVFTTFNENNFALVCQSAEDEDRQGVMDRAAGIITRIAEGATTGEGFNLLHRNTRTVTHANAIKEPYRAYLSMPFNLQWLQAQADASR